MNISQRVDTVRVRQMLMVDSSRVIIRDIQEHKRSLHFPLASLEHLPVLLKPLSWASIFCLPLFDVSFLSFQLVVSNTIGIGVLIPFLQ